MDDGGVGDWRLAAQARECGSSRGPLSPPALVAAWWCATADAGGSVRRRGGVRRLALVACKWIGMADGDEWVDG
jgi:hypothetical protein